MGTSVILSYIFSHSNIITLEELEVFENLKDDNLNLRVIDKSSKKILKKL